MRILRLNIHSDFLGMTSRSDKMVFPTLNEQMDVIRRGTVDLLPEDELVQKT